MIAKLLIVQSVTFCEKVTYVVHSLFFPNKETAILKPIVLVGGR